MDLKSIASKEDNTYIELIKIPEVKDLVIDVINKYGTEEKLNDANGVTDWLLFLLRDDKILSDTSHAYFVDLLLAASLLHNITYTYGDKKWTDIFDVRPMIEEMNSKYQMPDTYIDAICQPIETQLGKDMPNKLLVPNPSTPGAHFALACSIYYKKMK